MKKPGQILEQISRKEWEEANARADARGQYHPCEMHEAEGCFCGGACSCHWRRAGKTKKVKKVK